MFNVAKDIIEYAKNWKILKGYEGFLTNEQIAEFVGDLQDQVSLMDFSLPEGTTIIGYSGISNNVKAYEIVDWEQKQFILLICLRVVCYLVILELR